MVQAHANPVPHTVFAKSSGLERGGKGRGHGRASKLKGFPRGGSQARIDAEPDAREIQQVAPGAMTTAMSDKQTAETKARTFEMQSSETQASRMQSSTSATETRTDTGIRVGAASKVTESQTQSTDFTLAESQTQTQMQPESLSETRHQTSTQTQQAAKTSRGHKLALKAKNSLDSISSITVLPPLPAKVTHESHGSQREKLQRTESLERRGSSQVTSTSAQNTSTPAQVTTASFSQTHPQTTTSHPPTVPGHGHVPTTRFVPVIPVRSRSSSSQESKSSGLKSISSKSSRSLPPLPVLSPNFSEDTTQAVKEMELYELEELAAQDALPGEPSSGMARVSSNRFDAFHYKRKQINSKILALPRNLSQKLATMNRATASKTPPTLGTPAGPSFSSWAYGRQSLDTPRVPDAPVDTSSTDAITRQSIDVGSLSMSAIESPANRPWWKVGRKSLDRPRFLGGRKSTESGLGAGGSVLQGIDTQTESKISEFIDESYSSQEETFAAETITQTATAETMTGATTTTGIEASSSASNLASIPASSHCSARPTPLRQTNPVYRSHSGSVRIPKLVPESNAAPKPVKPILKATSSSFASQKMTLFNQSASASAPQSSSPAASPAFTVTPLDVTETSSSKYHALYKRALVDFDAEKVKLSQRIALLEAQLAGQTPPLDSPSQTAELQSQLHASAVQAKSLKTQLSTMELLASSEGDKVTRAVLCKLAEASPVHAGAQELARLQAAAQASPPKLIRVDLDAIQTWYLQALSRLPRKTSKDVMTCTLEDLGGFDLDKVTSTVTENAQHTSVALVGPTQEEQLALQASIQNLSLENQRLQEELVRLQESLQSTTTTTTRKYRVTAESTEDLIGTLGHSLSSQALKTKFLSLEKALQESEVRSQRLRSTFSELENEASGYTQSVSRITTSLHKSGPSSPSAQSSQETLSGMSGRVDSELDSCDLGSDGPTHAQEPLKPNQRSLGVQVGGYLPPRPASSFVFLSKDRPLKQPHLIGTSGTKVLSSRGSLLYYPVSKDQPETSSRIKVGRLDHVSGQVTYEDLGSVKSLDSSSSSSDEDTEVRRMASAKRVHGSGGERQSEDSVCAVQGDGRAPDAFIVQGAGSSQKRGWRRPSWVSPLKKLPFK